MENNNGTLGFTAGIDTAKLKRDVEDVKKQLEKISKKAETEAQKGQTAIDNMLKSATAFLTVRQAYIFANKIAHIRGEFQQLEVAFTTMLNSKGKADKLMSQVVDFAAKTPFTLQDVTHCISTFTNF